MSRRERGFLVLWESRLDVKLSWGRPWEASACRAALKAPDIEFQDCNMVTKLVEHDSADLRLGMWLSPSLRGSGSDRGNLEIASP